MVSDIPVSSNQNSLHTMHSFPYLAEAHFLNIKVHAMTMRTMHEVISYAIHTQQKWLIANHNLHSVYLLYKHGRDSGSGFVEYYRKSQWTHVDGMSIVALARFCGHTIRRSHRIAYNQSLPHLLTLAEQHGWRVFYLGSSESVSTAGLDHFESKYPALKLEAHHGFFSKDQDSEENRAVLDRIRIFSPHILFVGMGMPVQEEWIAVNYDSIAANIILASGATLDYFTGALPRPPAWLGSLGLEWLYRLVHEPRRLSFRYLVEPWYIMLHLLKGRLVQFKPRIFRASE